jgi:hypothetical protein
MDQGNGDDARRHCEHGERQDDENCLSHRNHDHPPVRTRHWTRIHRSVARPSAMSHRHDTDFRTPSYLRPDINFQEGQRAQARAY